jgi:orotidine-5'-phosphate decarboxylase
MLTVHAAGGLTMMREAVAAAAGVQVLAVTVLTSLDEHDLAAVGTPGPVDALVLRRALLAQQAGCAGVIASPQELKLLRSELPPSFLIVTPGVRPAGHQAGDQKRTLSPGQAVRDGADFLVVGRPVRDAADPRQAALAIGREIEGQG